ncbi:hypothetical protein NDU88_001190 [Pleurodeles waltl]|uniref:Uncharacterized protein n=1 Tax=Pleurodeles waltl TaxID=8319 RepID=A0AAV7U667_PLEWA|nr:hypothetical protein NDU88_001190 [Pleurodeles waltl]
MKSRKNLYQQELKPPSTFLDVVACFSEEEWKLLHEWQNELFNNVMKEIHQALSSLGPVIASSVFSLRAKENEHHNLSHHQDLERNNESHVTRFPALDADVSLRVEKDVEVGLVGDGSSKGGERIIIPHSGHPVERTDVLHKIKRDGPGTFTPVTSFRMIQEVEKSVISHRHSGTQDIRTQTGENVNSEDISFRIKEEGDGDFMCNQDATVKDHMNITRGINTSIKAMKNQQESHWEGASVSSECENKSIQKADVTPHHGINPGMTPHTQYDNGFPLWSPRLKRKRNHKGKKMQYVVAETKESINELIPIGSYQNMQTESKRYVCRQCGNCFQQSLEGTVRDQGNMEMQPNTCNDCEKSFRQLTNLNSDQGQHLGEKPHKCAECGKSFRIAQSLLIHQRVHTGEKPYTCNQCGKDFRQLPHLVKHQRRHTGEKPYVCIVCKRGFINSSNLKRHQQIHTRELGI